MKKTSKQIFALFLMLLSVNSFSQNLKSSLANGSTIYNTYETFNWDVVETEWTNNTITYITRNSNGTESIKLTNVWDAANGLFVNSTKETYTYNASGKLTIYLHQIWKTVDGILDWTNNKRTVYAYNASNLITSVTTYEWKMINAKYNWANINRHTYTYNTQSLVSEDRYQLGKEDTLWNDTTKILYVYDAKKNNIELTGQTWKSTLWENTYHHLYKYNGANKMTEDVYQTWDLGLTTPAWENIDKEAYNYDAKSNQVLIYYSDWDKGSLPPVWDTIARDTIIYNSKGWMYINEHHTGSITSWTNHSKITDFYDGYGNKIEEIFETWSGTWDKTMASRKWLRSYDIDKNLRVQITQNWDGLEYVNTIKEVYSDFNSYEPIVKNAVVSTGISYFPNPVVDNFTVSVFETNEPISIILSDLNGRIVLEKSNLSNPAVIDMSMLTAGFYIATIKSGNNISVEKIIKN